MFDTTKGIRCKFPMEGPTNACPCQEISPSASIDTQRREIKHNLPPSTIIHRMLFAADQTLDYLMHEISRSRSEDADEHLSMYLSWNYRGIAMLAKHVR